MNQDQIVERLCLAILIGMVVVGFGIMLTHRAQMPALTFLLQPK